MFIEKAKSINEKSKTYYRVGTGTPVRVIVVIGRSKVICANLLPPGGTFEVTYEEFQAAFSEDRIIAKPEADDRKITAEKYKKAKHNPYA